MLLRVELKPAPLERLPLKEYTRKWPSLRRGVPGPPKRHRRPAIGADGLFVRSILVRLALRTRTPSRSPRTEVLAGIVASSLTFFILRIEVGMDLRLAYRRRS